MAVMSRALAIAVLITGMGWAAPAATVLRREVPQGRNSGQAKSGSAKGKPVTPKATVIAPPGGGDPPPPQPAGATILSPSTGSTVYTGQAVSFTGDTNFGAQFYWTFGDGASATTLNATHAFTAAGTYSVSFRASKVGYEDSTATISLTVAAPPPAPSITSFTAAPTVVQPGGSSTLSWSAPNATSCSISGIGTVTGTSRSVSPSATTTYTLTASNYSGSVTATCAVTVNHPPSFSGSISAITLYPGDYVSVVLPAASDSDGDTITYSAPTIPPGMTFVPSTRTLYGAIGASGSYAVTEVASDGRGGNVSTSATWTVTNTAVHIQSFAASPTLVTPGNATTLSWSVSNATSLSISGIGTVSGTSTSVVPAATTTYTLTATKPPRSVTAQVTVTVDQLPSFTSSLPVQSYPANTPESFTLPAATDADGDAITYSVTGLPAGMSFNASTRVVSGSATAAGASTVTETATDARGGVTTQSAAWTVTVPPVPVISSLTASPLKINPGQSSTLAWSVSNPIQTLTLTGVGTVTGTTSRSVSPSATTAYTLTASNVGGSATKSVTVTVNQAPAIQALPLPGLRVNDYVASTLPSGTDADGDALSCVVTGLPPGLSFTAASHQVAGTPTTAGSYTVTETVTDPMGLTATATATWTVAAYDASTDPPAPSLPADDSVFHNPQFSEVMGYAGSDTGLITSVQVNRQLQTSIASLATGHDRATASSYTYGYDPLGQLVVANGTYTDPTGQVAAWTDNTTYAYDAHGNRTSNKRADGSTWAYAYNTGNNQLKTAGPKVFTYTSDGAVQSIGPVSGQTADTQTFTYGDPRFMRLPTQIVRNALDGRVITTDAWYDMSGTRVTKRDQAWQGSGTIDKTKLLSDRETIYLANGTDVLMETELRGVNGVLAPSRYTAYIFGAGSRLARLSWDADGRSASEAGVNIGVANAGFDDGTATSWTSGTGATLAGVSDPVEGPSLKVVHSSQTYSYASQFLGTFQAGDTLELTAMVRGDGAGGGALIRFAGTGSTGATGYISPNWTSTTWAPQRVVMTLPQAGDIYVWLLCNGTELQQAYFDQIKVRKLPPATVASGKPNLWPDPGFESVLGQGGGVSAAGAVAIAPGTREGLHVLNLASGATYTRQVTGLDPAKHYLFSVWKDPGTGWVRDLRPALAPDSGGNLTITLNQAANYDQAELVEDPGTAVESWIPENRLGRVDWFLTDHLGSTKLLVSQDGSWRYTGDDDPFGINLRSLGDKDSHRYTGQILDEDQGLYYYGARYYYPEIGRFLGGDPEQEAHSAYIYAANSPTNRIDPTGGFSTSVHEWIYNNYLKGNFSSHDIGLISESSAMVDSFFPGQYERNSYMHAMRSRSQTVFEAKKMASDYYIKNMRDAVSLELAGKHSEAMKALGKDMHLVSDASSPEHQWKVWRGFLGPIAAFFGIKHHLQEEKDEGGKPSDPSYRPTKAVETAGGNVLQTAEQFKSLVEAKGNAQIEVPDVLKPSAAEAKEQDSILQQRAAAQGLSVKDYQSYDVPK